jgi:hypothetical protein
MEQLKKRLASKHTSKDMCNLNSSRETEVVLLYFEEFTYSKRVFCDFVNCVSLDVLLLQTQI